MENMDHNAHSVYLMYYHLIMVVKYRRKVINDPISERAKEIWEYIAPRYGIVLEEKGLRSAVIEAQTACVKKAKGM